jgi:hypothetical protein
MERTLTLHFIDGTKLSFEYEAQTQNNAARQVKLNDFLSGKHLVVEAEGSVLIFPVSSIKYMALSATSLKGALPALPRHAIVGARIRA